jgi:HD-like signal output (HDOD) protein
MNNHYSQNCAAKTEIYRKITDISSKIAILTHDQDIIHQIGEHVRISMPIFKKWNVVPSHVIAVIGLSSVPILHVRG